MNVTNKIKKFFVQGPPPEPDLSRRLEKVGKVKELISPDQMVRILIVRESDNTFTFHVFKWDTSDWKDGGSAFWNDVTQGKTITDSAENAESIAQGCVPGIEFKERLEPNEASQDTLASSRS